MRGQLLLAILLFTIIAHSQTNGFHDTQGKLEISNSGQANYTLPIAMPPSLKNTGPVINIVYQSGNFGGVAGQGWNIHSISTICRINTRKDIDGFLDGVDFDDTDKLALNGQRLLLVSGQYWRDGSVYQTETQSNTKIELRGTGSGIYFIVTTPDGSRSWYGNYSGNNATDLTAFYINRFEDITGNYITYQYTKPFNKSLCISEIKFSANTNGLTPLNSILFFYKRAQRTESTYIKGVKLEKVALLSHIEVKTQNQLFRKYVFTHIADPQLGYEKLTQIQEFNAALEPANPIRFEYENTEMLRFGSEILTTYHNNLNFEKIWLSGDFDGDGRMDFITNGNKIHTNLFKGNSADPISVSFPRFSYAKFTATTVHNGKLNPFQSIVSFLPGSNSTTFHICNFTGVAGPLQADYQKTIALPNTGHCTTHCPSSPCYKNRYIKNSNQYLEGDFNGDGISEILIIGYEESVQYIFVPGRSNRDGSCREVYQKTAVPNLARILDLNANSSTTLGTKGYIELVNSQLLEGDRFHTMDFNGDGKTDLLIVKNNKTYKVINFKELTQAPWMEIEILGEGILDAYTENKQLLFGDFNGDGKTDIMLPKASGNYNETNDWWDIYYSNPKPDHSSFFETETFRIVDYWNNSGKHFNNGIQYSSYYVLDTNGDGKSDLVRIWRNHYKPKWTLNDHDTNWKITSYVNNIGKENGSGFTQDYTTPCQNYDNSCDHHSDSPDLVIPVVSTYRQGVNKEILMVRNHYNQVTYINFTKDVAKDILLKKVTTASGAIEHEISYQTLDPTDHNTGYGHLNEFYSSSNSQYYPYVEIKKLPLTKVVSKLTNKVLGIIKHQDFKYHGYTVNMEGIGALGFIKTARSSWYQFPSDKKIWSVIQNDPTLRGAMVNSYSILENPGTSFSFTTGITIPNNAISSTTNEYVTRIDNKVYIPLLRDQITTDHLTAVTTVKSYIYHPVFYLPEIIRTQNFLGVSLQGETTIEYEYENNASGTGNRYYIGRPVKTITTASAYNDRHSTETRYTYNTNGTLLKTQQKPLGENYYLTEKLEYDIYGNITKKTLSAPESKIPVTPRVTEYTYDPTGRFIASSKDIIGQVSEYTYHSLYGAVLTATDANHLTTTTTYDNWGKPKKVTDYLGKNTNYTYTKTNGEYTTRIVKDDGSRSILVANVLGQEIKKGTKLSNSQWRYTGTQYDFLGRKVKDYDVFSDTPSQWTSYSYDDYGRLIQTELPTGKITHITYNGLTVSTNDGVNTVTATKNANGHLMHSTDNGGTINYKYDAIGNLKESDYQGTKITIEYDKWGRKIRLHDPSAGQYRYEYYPFGEIRTEITPKGNTTKFIDDFGRITRTEEIDLTEKSHHIRYLYNSDHTFYGAIREDFLTGNIINEEYYEYDSYKRPDKITQITPHATFEKKLTYDAFGRIEKEKQTATVSASGKTSSRTFRYGYRFGYRYQTTDDSNGQVLWTENEVNLRNQLTRGTFGNGQQVSNLYDNYGYLRLRDTYHPNWEAPDSRPEFTIDYQFEPKTGNLNERRNFAFNYYETFQYDNLDRLIQWDKESVTIHNLPFDQGVGEFTPTNCASLTNENGKLKVSAIPSSCPGIKKVILTQGIPGEKIKFRVQVTKTSEHPIRVYIVEHDPVHHLYERYFMAMANNTELVFEHTVSDYPVVELHFDVLPLTETNPVIFYIDNLLVERSRTEQQHYDDQGRISENNLGHYFYDNNQKAYQNTSIELLPEANAYYDSREGIFNDGMEAQKGWEHLLKRGGVPSGNPIYDDSKSKSGKYALKIHSPDCELTSHSLHWIPIDNTTTTPYTFSGWVYSDGPSSQIFLFMNSENETGYYTIVADIYTEVTHKWVYLERTIYVPAHIKKLSIRVDNNGGGNVWFDDIRIRKTKNPKTALRQLNITYDMFKKPMSISETGVTKVDFLYDDKHFRNTMYYGGLEAIDQRPFRKDYASDGSVEITTNQLTNQSTFVFFVGGDAYTAPAIFKDDGLKTEYLYLHRDYQGSIVAISDQEGHFVEKRLFDPWGNLLQVQDRHGHTLVGLTLLDRGYTGHEHIQDIGIINMNGRLYDPKLHRFLSPDNYIQDPYNTQNYNRFGYCLNNPLKYTDTSGELIGIGAAVLISTAVAVTTYTVTALLDDIPFSAGGLIQSAAIGAFSGAVTFGIGQAVSNITQLGARIAIQSLAHGMFQGTVTGIQGGDFLSGFASGALSSIAASLYGGSGYTNEAGAFTTQTQGINGLMGGGNFGMIAFGTVSGGTGAALTGGNFWQGAATGLVVSGLNHAAHKMQEKSFDREVTKAYGTNADGSAPATDATLSNMKSKIPTLGRIYKGFGKNVKLMAQGKTATASDGAEAHTYVTQSGNFDDPYVYFYGDSFSSYRHLAHTMLHEFGHVSSYITHNFLNNFNGNKGSFTNKWNRAIAQDELFAHQFAFRYDGIPYKNTYSWQHNYNILH